MAARQSSVFHPLNAIATFILLILGGSALAILDAQWHLNTALLEAVHATVLTLLLIAGLVAHLRYPSIRQFGWYEILLGMALLAMGSWVDILDQADWMVLGIPMGHSWQQAFLEKILGYTAGIGFIGLGFYQWLPWMIRTRESVESLNLRLTHTLTHLDERVEAERVSISRELHDDVAQRLTALGFTAQLCEAAAGDQPDQRQRLVTIREELSESLKTIRQVCRNLRPEPLDVVGIVTALENMLAKLRSFYPQLTFTLTATPRDGLEHVLAQRSEEDQLHFFRLVQENVRNAVKHSQGTTIDVTLLLDASTLTVIISDDGVGLPWQGDEPTSEALVQAGHLGVAGLRERALALGALYHLTNRPEGGATATITLPLTLESNADG